MCLKNADIYIGRDTEKLSSKFHPRAQEKKDSVITTVDQEIISQNRACGQRQFVLYEYFSADGIIAHSRTVRVVPFCGQHSNLYCVWPAERMLTLSNSMSVVNSVICIVSSRWNSVLTQSRGKSYNEELNICGQLYNLYRT